uniref:Uncharacterized protein n=1 Tax=Siphoviridae sp. ct9lR64 TaxID=2826178 RepID=A0A8S5QXP8_9CAUD|nr:MAG TPA: hypothetical protein [Siphoviridae sp. ct9lR64]
MIKRCKRKSQRLPFSFCQDWFVFDAMIHL